jgi:hypothetical protein
MAAHACAFCVSFGVACLTASHGCLGAAVGLPGVAMIVLAGVGGGDLVTSGRWVG